MADPAQPDLAHPSSQDRLVTAITTLLRMGAEVEVDDRGMTASAPHGLRAAGGFMQTLASPA